MIEIWTDGSCNNNPKHSNHGFGGWGFILVKDGIVLFESLGFVKKSTSQRMEMKAVIEGLKSVIDKFPNSRVTVVSDSAYIINCFKERWYIRWIEDEYDDIKNSDYWKEMLSLYFSELVKVKFRKVKGHSGIKFNERADFLAGEARQFIINKNLKEL